MAKAKKLPSGSWRVQVCATNANGVQKRMSFTAPTKEEAEAKGYCWVADWKRDKDVYQESADRITVGQAVDAYIAARSAVLSPSTIAGYEKLRRNYMKQIANVCVDDVTTMLYQRYINAISLRISPKSVRNVNGLILPSLKAIKPDLSLTVALPKPIMPELYCPSDADIKTLLESIEGTELYKAVLLAAFGPLRRSEISALRLSDISPEECLVTVNKAYVRDSARVWRLKAPKTLSSYRTIILPQFVINAVYGQNTQSDAVVNLTPDQISDRFKKALDRTSLPHFRFHDLRHYCASIMHAHGIPDAYIQQRGGWASSATLNRVYRHAITQEAMRQNAAINDHFTQIHTIPTPCEHPASGGVAVTPQQTQSKTAETLISKGSAASHGGAFLMELRGIEPKEETAHSPISKHVCANIHTNNKEIPIKDAGNSIAYN